MTIIEDFKNAKAWIIGVVGFATSIGGVLIEVFDYPTKPTISILVMGSTIIVGLVFLVKKSEERQKEALKAQETKIDVRLDKTNKDICEIKDVMFEIQRSSLRTEMNLMMSQNPSNHDTILKMAHRYFVDLNGDWVETDEFETWRENENNAGRPVHLPLALTKQITLLQNEEQ